MKLSVVLATFNEEKNIVRCLQSVKEVADEMIVVDGSSSDKTVELAKGVGARVIVTENHPIFHINKQKALEEAKGEWILQLDADEVVSSSLSDEIIKIISMTDSEITRYESNINNKKLLLRHLELIEKRDGQIGDRTNEYTAFFIPRLNFFLGKFLRFGGVYPDGVIRLVKNGKAHFPCKSVHEQIAISGRVGWLQSDLLHFADRTFSQYLYRNNRYINLIVDELKEEHMQINIRNTLNYLLVKPLNWFLLTQIRHKGILDGWQGVVFSFFSALRFPRAYLRYIQKSS